MAHKLLIVSILALHMHVQSCAIEILQQVFRNIFGLFWPSSKRNPETNDTSFESPFIELWESGEELGTKSSWDWPHTLDKAYHLHRVYLVTVRKRGATDVSQMNYFEMVVKLQPTFFGKPTVKS